MPKQAPVDGDLPDVFLWTKMGYDAKQGLCAILIRKELERQAGNGEFNRQRFLCDGFHHMRRVVHIP